MARNDVPMDVVSNILVRLPVKTLLRFKCVERSWNALLRSPTFVKTHMQMHQRDDLLMISHCVSTSFLSRRLTIISDSHTQTQPHFDMKSHLYNNLYYLSNITLYGHCNGVFCLHAYYKNGRTKLILWNPATKEVKVIPPPPLFQMHSHDHYNCLCGFGADPESNELKVINLVFDYDNKLHHPTSAKLYNLAQDSWTLIPNDTVPALNLCPHLNSYLVNGVCYWLNGIGDDACQTILCFDFCNNQFCKLKPPPTSTGSCHDFVTEVNDSLVYVVHCYHGNRCNTVIWIMEQDNWTKTYNIGTFEINVGIYAIWKGGTEFLGAPKDGGFGSYNLDGQLVSRFQVSSYPNCYVRNYVESITPLSF